jgi:hypothetical protein
VAELQGIGPKGMRLLSAALAEHDLQPLQGVAGSAWSWRTGADLREYCERVTRIELALSAWEADVLPLNYTRGPATVLVALASSLVPRSAARLLRL